MTDELAFAATPEEWDRTDEAGLLRERAAFLADLTARAVTEPRRFHESADLQHDLGIAIADVRRALAVAQVPAQEHHQDCSLDDLHRGRCVWEQRALPAQPERRSGIERRQLPPNDLPNVHERRTGRIRRAVAQVPAQEREPCRATADQEERAKWRANERADRLAAALSDLAYIAWGSPSFPYPRERAGADGIVWTSPESVRSLLDEARHD